MEILYLLHHLLPTFCPFSQTLDTTVCHREAATTCDPGVYYMSVPCVHGTLQLASHEQCVGGSLTLVAPLGCHKSRGSMTCCQEMRSNEGLYSRRATQKECEWVAQGLCLAPSLCRRRESADTTHWNTPKQRGKKKKKQRLQKKKFCLANLLRFQPAHTVVGVHNPTCFYWSAAIRKTHREDLKIHRNAAAVRFTWRVTVYIAGVDFSF